jgi:prevent-host-death family protein
MSRSVGIRALQQNAAKVLRTVGRGAAVEVTDRGRRVAWLVPATGGSVLEALQAAGRLTPAEGDLLDLGDPLRLRKGLEAPSRRLHRMRESER